VSYEDPPAGRLTRIAAVLIGPIDGWETSAGRLSEVPAIRAAGQTMPRVALSAVAWCCVFAAAHLFWAVGGSAGLASPAGADLAARRPAASSLSGCGA